MTTSKTILQVLNFTLLAAVVGTMMSAALAGPKADVAKKCMHYSYIAYPYKRPGSVRGSGDRQAYFQDCMAKEGNVSEPAPPGPAKP